MTANIAINPNLQFSPIGGNLAFWASNKPQIGEFIKTNGLKPTVIARSFGPINGGIQPAHLHFNTAIYMLTAKQWSTFSAPVINRAINKLQSASTIPFQNAITIAHTANNM